MLNVGTPQPGQTVIVVGLGGVGMAAMLTALAHDDVRVVAVVDQLAEKLERARAMGAHETFTPQAAREQGLKGAVVIEAAGHPSRWTSIDLTAPGGRTITVGLPHPTLESPCRRWGSSPRDGR